MKILHVIPGLTRERGGPSTVLEALVRHQVVRGEEVSVLTTTQGHGRGEHSLTLDAKAEVETLPVLGPDRLAYAPGFREAARRRIAACDLVHVHSIFTHPVHTVLVTAIAKRKPVILRPCGQLHRYSLRRSKWRKSLYLLQFGTMVRRAVRYWHYTSTNESQQSWPFDDSPRFVLPNGVEPGEFSLSPTAARQRLRQRWPELADAPYVLFLGRLAPKKRLDLLIDAFAKAAPRDCRLVIAGPDEEGLWLNLAARVSSLPSVASRVSRLGMVAGEDKAALLAAATLFSLPSEHENFGVAALEALAAGVPALLSPHVDLADMAEKAGAVVTAPLNVEAWRDQLTELLGEPARLSAMGQLAKKFVAENFAWSQIVEQLAGHYRTAIK